MTDPTESPPAVTQEDRNPLERVWARLDAEAEMKTNDEVALAEKLGIRDGFSEAIQLLDMLTGGDGEYRYCTDHDPERHCPTPVEMGQRIIDRLATRPAPLAQPGREEVDCVGLAVWCASIADHHADTLTPRQIEKLYAASDALRAAEPLLARQDARPVVEPVAWMYEKSDTVDWSKTRLHPVFDWTETPLYAHPATLPTDPDSVREESARLREALKLWLAYDEQDEDSFSGIGPMIAYSDAIEATRAALSTEEPNL